MTLVLRASQAHPQRGDRSRSHDIAVRDGRFLIYHENIPKDILVRQYPLGDRLLCEACPKEHRERLRTFIADRPVESH